MYAMKERGRDSAHWRSVIEAIGVVCMVVIMANLNAVVDHFLHPGIPYFDQEHLIVGGTTALASAILFGLLMTYIRYLRRAMMTIRALEAILPICTVCRKIRKPDTDPNNMTSWQPLDAYVTEKTATMFSHGVCPECMAREFPDYLE